MKKLSSLARVRRALGSQMCYGSRVEKILVEADPAGRGDHAYWKELYKDPERYDAEKKDIAVKVIGQLERWLPAVSQAELR